MQMLLNTFTKVELLDFQNIGTCYKFIFQTTAWLATPTVTLNHVILGTDLDVGVVLAGGAPLTSTALLFSVLIELRVAEDGHSPALIDQSHGCRTIQTLFVCSRHRQHHRH